MGRPEQFAQRTFAEETERVTGGAAGWQEPDEISLEKVQNDGYLLIREPHRLQHLAAPWPEAQPHAEVLVELKLPGNHLDRSEAARALLRRQARELQRIEADASWMGDEPLWLVAPHVPQWLKVTRRAKRIAKGCYWVEPCGRIFLWIAANELPLEDELIPFLMARSGPALDKFGYWVAQRRPFEWVLGMLEYLPMTTLARADLIQRFGKAEDPEVEARRQHILEVLLETSPQTQQQHILEVLLEANPETQQQLIDKGRLAGQMEGQMERRLAEGRAALRRVLMHRQLTPSEAEAARIEACADVATLARWQDRAFTAASVADALQ